MLAIAINLFALALFLSIYDAFSEEMFDRLGLGPAMSEFGGPGQVDYLDDGFLLMQLVPCLVGLLLLGALAFAMRRGADRGRITLTVLGGIGVPIALLIALFLVPILFAVGEIGALTGLLITVSPVLIILAIVFMFRPQASHYFRHIGASRARR